MGSLVFAGIALGYVPTLPPAHQLYTCVLAGFQHAATAERHTHGRILWDRACDAWIRARREGTV